MKLYSRGQVVFFSLMSAVLVLIGVLAAGYFRSVVNRSRPQVAVSVATNAGSDALPPVRPGTTRVQAVDSSSARYSEDELQNIRIYQRLNAGVVNVTTETVALNWFLEPVPQGGGIGSGRGNGLGPGVGGSAADASSPEFRPPGAPAASAPAPPLPAAPAGGSRAQKPFPRRPAPPPSLANARSSRPSWQLPTRVTSIRSCGCSIPMT